MSKKLIVVLASLLIVGEVSWATLAITNINNEAALPEVKRVMNFNTDIIRNAYVTGICRFTNTQDAALFVVNTTNNATGWTAFGFSNVVTLGVFPVWQEDIDYDVPWTNLAITVKSYCNTSCVLETPIALTDIKKIQLMILGIRNSP